MGKDAINPKHYEGSNGLLAIEIVEQFNLGFCLGNAVKYICRAGKKDPAKEVEDLKKSIWNIERRIKQLTPANGGILASYRSDSPGLRPLPIDNEAHRF